MVFDIANVDKVGLFCFEFNVVKENRVFLGAVRRKFISVNITCCGQSFLLSMTKTGPLQAKDASDLLASAGLRMTIEPLLDWSENLLKPL